MTRALALSGGGGLGAYQVGALKALMLDDGARYDAGLFGVSAGAANCAALAQFHTFEDHHAWGFLAERWEALRTKDVIRRWFPFGKLHGLWRASLYDTKPLWELVSKWYLNREIWRCARTLGVGATNLSTGKWRVFKNTVGEDGVFRAGVTVDALVASMAQPFIMTPVSIGGQPYVDGGIRSVTPLGAAIRSGADSVDVVMCSAPYPRKWNGNSPTALDIGPRTVDILIDEITQNDLKFARLYNELAANGVRSDKRVVRLRVIRPQKPLPGDSLSFDPKQTARLIELGYRDASRILAAS